MPSARTVRPCRLTLRGTTLRLALRALPSQPEHTVDPLDAASPRPTTLADLRASGWRPRTVKEELRANLLERLGSGGAVFPGVVGLRGDGRPGDRERDPGRPRPRLPRRARPGQDADGAAAGRSARPVAAGRPRRRAQRRPVRADQPGRPRHRRARRRRDRDRLAAARPPLRREARDARHHDRRPDRRGRPDQGRRGPLPVRRADPPLRPDPARQPRHRRDQRAARPGRADPGRPAQHPRGARRPDPRLRRPAAARPVHGRLGQPGGLHLARPDHHAAQGPPRVADPDPLPAHARARDGDRPPGEAPLPGRGRRPARGRAGVHGGAGRRADPPGPSLGRDQPAIRASASASRSPTPRCSRPPRSSGRSGSASRSARRASRTSARSSPRRSARSSSRRPATNRPRSGSSSG